MRTEEDIMNLILNFARNDDRVRAVLLTGSRANPDAAIDRFSDFDVVYFVTKPNTFLNDQNWINYFGERLILQMPKEMVIGNNTNDPSFQYLMLFKDRNRIDLTLFPLDKMNTEFKNDGHAIVWLDKDNILGSLPAQLDSGYLIQPPKEKEFQDVCNEFWWVSTYVAKGLGRNELVYARHVSDVIVREMFLKMVEWHIGVKTSFTVSFGQHGRNIKQLVSEDLYEKILSTYPDAEIKNTWHSLLTMADIFNDLAANIAQRLNFNYDREEASNISTYLRLIYQETLPENGSQ